MPSRTTDSDKAYPHPGAIIEIGKQGGGQYGTGNLCGYFGLSQYRGQLFSDSQYRRHRRTGEKGGTYADRRLFRGNLRADFVGSPAVGAHFNCHPDWGSHDDDPGGVSLSVLAGLLFQCGLLYLAGFLFGGLMVAVWFFAAAAQYGLCQWDCLFSHPRIGPGGMRAGLLRIGLAFTRRRHPGKEIQGIAQVRITLNGKQVSLIGMVDTGNHLTDPFSGKPVVLCRYQLVKEILPESICRYFDREDALRFEQAAMQESA